jgi:hypothetical protein
VIAQVHDQQLRRQRLPGVPGRALRLAAPALGAGREVEQALPGKVLDLAPAHQVVLAWILEIDRTAGGVNRQQRAERTGATGERDVDDGRHDVQVLAVHNEHEESQDDADGDQDRDGLDGLVGLLTQRAEQPGDPL